MSMRSIIKKHLLPGIIAVVSLMTVHTVQAQDGRALFNANCASCHKMDKDLTGPALQGVVDRWSSEDLLKLWIRNWPAAVATGDKHAVEMKDWSPAAMTLFPNLTDDELNALINYMATWQPPAPPPGPAAGVPAAEGDNSLLFGIISLILALVAIILLQVNSNLKRLSDEKSGIPSLEPVSFWKNKTYIGLASVVFFIIAGIYISKGAVGLGRMQNYQPEQPIYYSHTVHAGVNQVNCLYCHGGAAEGKHANIPSVNVCMNCHLAINEYKGDPLYREDGTEVDGTAEIQKLYDFAGFTPGQPWDPSKAKPIDWIRIHNLPDHVYFNHAQHVKAGKVACQTCHGEVQKMGEVYQYSDLSMGWCINCHRETEVQFADNGFYSIYEKFHEDVKNGKLDKVTVETIGGTECQKCHY
jgi:cytochrome c551/c552